MKTPKDLEEDCREEGEEGEGREDGAEPANQSEDSLPERDDARSISVCTR